MRYVSLFSGIESATVAWEPLGWRPLAFAEIDPFASAVLNHRFHSGRPKHMPDPLSAGLTMDERKARVAAIRAVASIPRHASPHVPQNLGDVTAVDWSKWRGRADLLVGGPPCQAFSVAGLRNSLDDDRGNLSLEYVRAIHAVDPTWTVTENVPGWLSTKDNAFGCFLAGLVGEDAALVPPGGRWTDAGVVVGPERAAAWRVLDAQYFGLAQRRRRVFVVSCRTRDGINPAAVLFEPEGMLGHSPPRREAGAQVAGALTAQSGDGRGWRIGADEAAAGHIVARALTASVGGPDDNAAQATHLLPVVAHTVTTREGQRSETETLLPMPFAPEQITSATNRSNPQPGDPCPTLTGSSGQPPAVAFDWQAPAQHSLNPAQVSPPLCTNRTPAVFRGGVRRLMPVECELLQGLPRDWTLVPYRGKPAKDSPRYRAVGNGMAVNCMRWIGLRIAMVDAR